MKPWVAIVRAIVCVLFMAACCFWAGWSASNYAWLKAARDRGLLYYDKEKGWQWQFRFTIEPIKDLRGNEAARLQFHWGGGVVIPPMHQLRMQVEGPLAAAVDGAPATVTATGGDVRLRRE